MRIGVVHLYPHDEPPVVVGLRQGLGELGYREEHDVVLDIRSVAGGYEAALEAIHELVRRRVSVLVSAGTVASQAAQAAGENVPIVFTQVGDPVGAGFVDSFARPGHNMTGFSHLLPAASGKRLELLLSLAPGAQNVLVLYSPTNPSSVASIDAARTAASMLQVGLDEQHVNSREDLIARLRDLDPRTIDAILVLPDSLVVNSGDELIRASREWRIPIMFHEADWAVRGGLASYGPSFSELGRQAAGYVHKIIGGLAPSDLPVQQPTSFELVLNLGAADSLGITFPEVTRVQAARLVS